MDQIIKKITWNLNTAKIICSTLLRMHLKIFKFIYITLRMQEINPAELFSRGHPVYTETGNMENVKNVFMQTPFIMST
jgi:hypothetical protein